MPSGSPAGAEPGTPLTYEEARTLEPVRVDDLLRVHPDAENVALLDAYVSRGLGLVPIRRRSLQPARSSEDFPARVLLELTSLCSLTCTMCPRNVLRRPMTHMPTDVALRCIDELDEHGIDGLWLYNIGESMLHPDFAAILAHVATKRNLGSVWLSTNGQRLEEEHVDLILSPPLTFLNFSLNAMNAETYRKVSPDGDYGVLLENLARLVARKRELGREGSPPWLRIQMIDQPAVGPGELDRFLAEYAGRGDILSVNLLEAFSQDVAENVEYATARDRSESKRCNRLVRGDAFIFSDGEVGFCDTDFNHDASLGNVCEAGIAALWSGETRRRYLQLNEEGRLNDIPMCSRCMDWDL